LSDGFWAIREKENLTGNMGKGEWFADLRTNTAGNAFYVSHQLQTLKKITEGG
jgi:hypothetical protein